MQPSFFYISNNNTKFVNFSTYENQNIFSRVAQNTELCGSKFYHAQQHPGIPFTQLSRLFCLIED